MNEKQATQARRELAMLYGHPPYNTWSNICYGDGYYANSLVRRYGMSIEELRRATGYGKREKKALKHLKSATKKAESLLL